MRRIGFFALIFFFVSYASFVIAQENIEDVSPDMKVIQVGPGAEVILPEDMKVIRRGAGSQLAVEDLDAYVERKLKFLENRVAELKASNDELRKEVEQLKSVLIEIGNKLTPQQKEVK